MNTQLMRNYCLETITQIFFFFFCCYSMLIQVQNYCFILLGFLFQNDYAFHFGSGLSLVSTSTAIFILCVFFLNSRFLFCVQNTRFSRYDQYEIPMYLYWSKFKCDIYQLEWYGINIISVVYKIIYSSSIFPIP